MGKPLSRNQETGDKKNPPSRQADPPVADGNIFVLGCITGSDTTITLQGNTGVLSINSREVARNPAMTFDPVDIAADLCYLGRGTDGNFFRGRIDSFLIEKTVARP
jgi:hypothetical protein